LVTKESAIRLLDDAVQLFESIGDNLSAARALHIIAGITGPESEEPGLRAREHYKRAGLGPELTANLLAVNAAKGPTPVPEAIRRCHELLAETMSPGYRSFVLPQIACLEAMDGRFPEARGLLEEARIARREFSDPATIASSWAYQAAWVELLAGAPEAAEAILSEACETLRVLGDDAWLATNLALLAEAECQQGRYDDALTVTKEALAFAPADDSVSQRIARFVRAKALARTGKLAQAERLAREAVAISSSHELNEHGEVLLALAEVLGLRGKATEAAEALEQARALFEAKGNVIAADRTRASLLALAG
jgi:tetratricopeptide (TPR) repeat protein